ncbi:aquaporin-like protein [Russula emetica]|nr:aquaporin-like protein [Russula emetica]
MAGVTSSHLHPIHHPLHLVDIEPRPAIFRSWERARERRAHWLVECIAEMFAVFCYCYAGQGATAAFIIGNILKLDGTGCMSPLFTIGVAYGLGVVVALVVCTATSGGHFTPSVTVIHALFNGCPPAKAARLVKAKWRFLGAFIASWFVYWQWHTLIEDAEAALISAGVYDAENFSSSGVAGIFAFYANPKAPLAEVFLNEFVSNFFIGTVIAACLDPTNLFSSPVAVPWIVGMTFGTTVWGFAMNGLASNTARDVGGRLVAISIWGTRASGGRYAAIAALTNIPATVAAYAFYEFTFKDSSRGNFAHNRYSRYS